VIVSSSLQHHAANTLLFIKNKSIRCSLLTLSTHFGLEFEICDSELEGEKEMSLRKQDLHSLSIRGISQFFILICYLGFLDPSWLDVAH
jgi:hypothetical protein